MVNQIIRLSTAGSVDDGKSTLLGRLLFDSKKINEDDIDRVKRKSSKDGNIDFSLFTDGLKDEIEQGITIDVAYRYFNTKKRKFIISDTPGHIQYTRNMITGGSLSNITLVLLDVKKGVTEQTKRHLFISSLLRINHVIVCINKMDLVDYDEESFDKIKNEIEFFASKLSTKDITFIPISALKGENITKSSDKMSWYNGPTLLYQLENIHISSDLNKIKSRFLVQNVIKTKNNEKRFLLGRINSGIFRKNDSIIVHPNKIKTKIKNIKNGFNDIHIAYAPMSISIEVRDNIDIGRGNLITKEKSLPFENKILEVIICWLDEMPLNSSDFFKAYRISEEFKFKILEFDYKYNINDLRRIEVKNEILMNDIFKAKIKLSKNISYDLFSDIKETGSFIFVNQKNSTVGCAMITG